MAEEEEEFPEETDEDFFGSVGQIVDRTSLAEAIVTASRRAPLEAVVAGLTRTPRRSLVVVGDDASRLWHDLIE